jgi:hypothetical protein
MTDRHDPPIDEIRAVRRQISAECGHDPEALAARYMAMQTRYRDRLADADGAASPALEPAA